ncbi:MAG: family 16 glycoside hydrolase, partial [Brevefilum fermentans]
WMVTMKKLFITTILILAFALSGCHFPGFQSDSAVDPEDVMATEISKILTGTPIQIEPSATTIIEVTSPTEEIIKTEAVEPAELEEPQPTPAPTHTPPPTLTATLASTDPTLNLGDPDWVDNMDDGDGWPTGLDKYTAIKFENGFLKLTSSTGVDGWRVTWPTIANFYLEMTLQTPECEGSDQFGLMFRVPADSQAGKGYLYGITCDGRYSLRRWDGSVMHSLIGLTPNDAVKKGPDAVNKLGVMARGANLALYVNGQKVNEISDSTHLQGRFGVFVGGMNVDNLTVWVDQIRYWDGP